MQIKEQDKIIILTGKYKKKEGKVLKVLKKDHKVIIENINTKIKHIKPNSEGKKGTIKTIEAPIDISNIALIQ